MCMWFQTITVVPATGNTRHKMTSFKLVISVMYMGNKSTKDYQHTKCFGEISSIETNSKVVSLINRNNLKIALQLQIG